MIAGKNLNLVMPTREDYENVLGEASFYHYDAVTKSAMLNIRIKSMHRGRGLGTEALDLLLAQYFEQWGGLVIEDRLDPANRGGMAWMERLGFKETRRDPEGVWMELHAEDFRSALAARDS
jgi:RimJ/RimL family protein N-acetyltransferase